MMLNTLDEIKNFLLNNSSCKKIIRIVREKEKYVEFLGITHYNEEKVWRVWKVDGLITTQKR